MSLEVEQSEIRRRSREAQERAVEVRESKEKEMDPEAQAAATMERADFLVKEVKSGKQQVQNIMLHMQQVLVAIQALRQQLQLQTDGSVSSVEQDKKQIETLKKKIIVHKDELLKMKEELINTQVEEIRKGGGAGLSDAELRAKSKELVERIITELGE
ncbi:MAG: hypothetical protein WCW16_02075 [Candidatus Magasanikbacteria bacterium]|jgi:hypothetical protein